MISERADAVETLWVWTWPPLDVEPVLCGRFEREVNAAGLAKGMFVYGKSYLARANALPLDPVLLPLRAIEFETTALDGWFSVFLDAGPDAWGKRLIDRAVGPQTQAGYLRLAGGHAAGALAFGARRDEPPPPALTNTTRSLAKTLELQARVEAGEQLSAQETARLLASAGSGGARPKQTLEDGGALWIAKGVSAADNADFAPVPCTEAALLTLAGRCGITVPRHRVIQVSGRPVLLIERFDRVRVDGGVGRWRYASAQTLFWSRPEVARYSFQGSYLNLALRLREWERRPGDSVRELYRRIVFNALVGNTDDHDKNHALVAGTDGEFALAPAFDLTICATGGRRQLLQMPFGEDGALITLENLLSKCESFGFTKAEAHDIVVEQWRVVSTQLPQALADNGSSDGAAARTIARMPGFDIMGAGTPAAPRRRRSGR